MPIVGVGSHTLCVWMFSPVVLNLTKSDNTNEKEITFACTPFPDGMGRHAGAVAMENFGQRPRRPVVYLRDEPPLAPFHQGPRRGPRRRFRGRHAGLRRNRNGRHDLPRRHAAPASGHDPARREDTERRHARCRLCQGRLRGHGHHGRGPRLAPAGAAQPPRPS